MAREPDTPETSPTSNLSGSAPGNSGPIGDAIPRRNALVSFMAGFIGFLITIVPIITGAAFFLDPLLRKKKGAGTGDGFVKVASLNTLLNNGGKPEKVTVRADQIDAWNMSPNQPIGAVYLQVAEGGKEITAFNTTCPHLGCTVEYSQQEGQDEAIFWCPCHASAFALDGKRLNEIPPRGLDQLTVEVRNSDEIWVKFEQFLAGKEEKISIS